MKYLVILWLIILSNTVSANDVVNHLRELRKQSEDYQEIIIDCFVELKLSKAEALSSKECTAYIEFSKTQLPIFQHDIKATIAKFRALSKNDTLSHRRIKRGLRELLKLQANALSIKKINNDIKAIAKRKY